MKPEKKSTATDDRLKQLEQDANEWLANNPDKAAELQKAVESAAEFQRQHADAMAVLYGSGFEKQRNAFIDQMTVDDYERVLDKAAPAGLAEALAIQAKTPSDYEQKMFAVYDLFDLWELIEVYERTHPQGVNILPTSPTTHLINKTFAAIVSGRLPAATKGTELTFVESKENNSLTIVQRGKSDVIQFTIKDKDLYCMLQNKRNGRKYRDLRKMFAFILITCNDQGFNSPVVFNIHDLVTAGMYSDYVAARRGFETYMPRIYSGLDYSIKRKRGKSITESGIGEGHGFISSYELPPGSSTVTINIDSNFDIRTLAEFFTILPKWALALDPNPYSLIDYVFTRGRQECDKIAATGSFNIGFDALRDYLGLPEYAGKDDYNRIKRPIMSALEKVEDAILLNDDKNIKLTPMLRGGDVTTAQMREWLFNGYIQVELSGHYAEYFVRRAADRTAKIDTAKRNAARRKKAAKTE